MRPSRSAWLWIVPWLLGTGCVAATEPSAGDSADWQPRFVPRGEVHAQQPGNLHLVSVLAPDGAPYPGTQFSVLREEPDAFGKTRFRVMAASGPHDQAAFDLAPGRYTVQARNGAVTVEHKVEIPPTGGLSAQVVLNAGELHLGALLAPDGPAAAETWFRVSRDELDAYGRQTRVQIAGNGYAQTSSFVLPAGVYTAEARYGDALVEAQVEVAAGQVVTRELVLNAGRLDLSSALTEHTIAPRPTHYTIYRIGDAGEALRSVTDADASEPIGFVLPAGRYVVRASVDLASVEVPVTIDAGETTMADLSLNAGELLVYAILAGDTDPLLNAWFMIEAADSPPGSRTGADEVRGPAHNASFVVPAGRYRVKAGIGESEGTEEVVIEPGGRHSLAISLDAARVVLRLSSPSDPAPMPYTWFSVYRIERDARGAEWRRRVYNAGYFPETEIVLPAGNYLAVARSYTGRGERTFRVAPGETLELGITADTPDREELATRAD